MIKQSFIFSSIATLVLLSGCATTMKTPEVPAAIAVPAGNKVVMSTLGIGELTYECRIKANTTDAFEWVLAGPEAMLYNSKKVVVGKYYKGPTWESNDGSKVTGKQLAISPNPGSIPLQLVQANPAMGNGVMTGVTYIQRLNTVAGLAPSAPCAASTLGTKEKVNYQADYIFYKAM